MKMLFSLPAPAAPYILAGLFSCSPQSAPTVTLQIVESQPQIVNSQPSTSLFQMGGDSISPDYGKEFSVTGGLTYSNIKTKFDMDFTSTLQPVINNACLWVTGIKITVTYTPVIYIASNHRPGSCNYTAILEHEQRHVAVDRAFLNDLALYMQKAAEISVSQGYSIGPIKIEQREAEQDALSNKIEDRLKKIHDDQENIRINRQKEVDSLEEYSRLSVVCR